MTFAELKKQIGELEGASKAIQSTLNALSVGLFAGSEGAAIGNLIRFHQQTLQATQQKMQEVQKQFNELTSDKPVKTEEPKLEQPAA